MSYNSIYYLHFVTDLRRIVFCMNNKDTVGAKSFLQHAHKIFEEKLMQIMDGESKELRIDELWLDIYSKNFPNALEHQQQYCEKILTLSSMIFLRSTQKMAVLPHESKIAESIHAVVSAK